MNGESDLVLRPLESDAGVSMPVSDFRDGVETGLFTDYDGYGELATETQVSNQVVSPSDLLRPSFVFPEWATRIVWYNR